MGAKKKYYGVRVGKTTGIFDNWTDCKASVDGFPNAEYKGFVTLEEAKEYVRNTTLVETECGAIKESDGNDAKNDSSSMENKLIAYVDGSYNDAIKKYAFGCVFILPDGRVYLEYGNGDDPKSLEQRNVSGEMLGAMFATQFAIKNRFEAIDIYYDYKGIEDWVTGAWKAKNELTQKYSKYMRECGQKILIRFFKVAAHTNVKYNELADVCAKRGLEEGNGVPAARFIEDMEQVREDG